MFEFLGITGIAISVVAYLPQVVHLAREHCSAGVSRGAWAMWLASSLLVGALAVHRGDSVFMLLQASSLTSAAAILVLARKYRGMVCATHAQLAPPRRGPVASAEHTHGAETEALTEPEPMLSRTVPVRAADR